MAIAHDAVSESHTGTTGSISEASFSWTHTPAGAPDGVLVFVFNTLSNTDDVVDVWYGGFKLRHNVNDRALDTAGELGDAQAFFISPIPLGAQTVLVNRLNNTDELYAVACTVTSLYQGGSDLRSSATVLLQENQVPAEVNVNDGSPGTNSLRYAGMFYGGAAIPVAGASSTALVGIDFGARTVGVVRETTAGQGARPVGFADLADDVAGIHVVIRENAPLVLPSLVMPNYIVPRR